MKTHQNQRHENICRKDMGKPCHVGEKVAEVDMLGRLHKSVHVTDKK